MTPIVSKIGLGCMRLSTAPDRDDARAILVIHAALDAGATLLDTSDAYCHDDTETGHNERLIAKALATWGGDRSRITIATKGGLRRPGGKWVNDAKAKSLRAACDASRRALGVDVIDLYQLHAVDPKTSLETSVRALAALEDDGWIRRIGLCNVTVTQIEAARKVAEISSVQVSLSPLDDANLRNGVAEYCRDSGIQVIAYRPLGGERVHRIAKDPVLRDVAARRGATPHEIALAWLMDLNSLVTPIPGATRVETASSLRRVLAVRLEDDDRRELDARFSGRLLRVPRSQRRPRGDADGDVVLVMGMPAAGKSSVARELADEGYERLNRDERGGALSDLIPELEAGLTSGQRRWVLDNTYASRAARNEVIEAAWSHGVPARCIWVATPLADAQVNAIARLVEVHGSLPSPEVLRERGKDDPRYFGPDAQFRFERTVEPPRDDEGFESLTLRPFIREANAASTAKAIVFDFDDLLTDDAATIQSRRATLQRYERDGWLLFAHAWRPAISKGMLSLEAARADFDRTKAALGVELTIACCPHDAGPPICWCRKPIPGSLIEFAIHRTVALDKSIIVGHSAADKTMAERLGVRYVEAAAFFE
jgi:aryl-alcohol dehydrogenase-like predicted oxidoreductase/predicted kinase